MNETLVNCFGIFLWAVIVIGFVLAFIESPPARFVMALVLFVSGIIGLGAIELGIAAADQKAHREAEARVEENRRKLAAEEAAKQVAAGAESDAAYERARANGFRPYASAATPVPATPVPLFYPPTPPPRRAATAAEVNAELLRKYGASR